MQNSKSLIDDIIKKWFPIIGILFVVSGISYLFYDGIWQTLKPPGRLVLGFVSGIGLITGGYGFNKNLKQFADAIIGGGLLVFYITLIYGSRFGVTYEQAIIPELPTLLVAAAFSAGVSFYSYTRKSLYILLLGMLGGYLTPFFIGDTGEFFDYLKDEKQIAFSYNLPLIAFLLYFCAINCAVFVVANKLFLKGIGILNSIGLFIGTVSLGYLMGGKLIAESPMILSVFAVIVVGLHIASMAVNAKSFQKETDPYLLAGYILPLLWFTVFMNSLVEGRFDSHYILGGIFGLVGVIYIGAWYFLRNVTESDRHFALYIGGILAGTLGFMKLEYVFKDFDSLVVGAISLVFAFLYILRPLVQREVTFLVLAACGAFFTINDLSAIPFQDFWRLSGNTIFVSLGFAPFLISFIFPNNPKELEGIKVTRNICAVGSAIIISLLLVTDIIDFKRVPKDFLFFTIPGGIVTYFALKKQDIQLKIKQYIMVIVLAMLGFFLTFFTILERFYPAPSDTMFLSTQESFIGICTIAILGFVRWDIRKILKNNQEARIESIITRGFLFWLAFAFFLSLWAVVSHEILGFYNLLSLDFTNPLIRGIRAFTFTLWWTGLASWMIYLGIRNDRFLIEKHIGFGLLAVTILKIVFYDLMNVNVNLKIFLLIFVGILILGISYMANKKDEKN